MEVQSADVGQGGFVAVVALDQLRSNGKLLLLDRDSNTKWEVEVPPLTTRVLDVVSEGASVAVAIYKGDRVVVYDLSGISVFSHKFTPDKGSVSADGRHLILASGSSVRVVSYDPTAGKTNYKDYGVDTDVLSVSFSSNGKYAAAGNDDGFVYVFDPSGNLLWKYKTGGGIFSLAVSNEGEVIAGSRDKFVYHLDESGNLKQKSPLPAISNLAVSYIGSAAMTEKLGTEQHVSYYSLLEATSKRKTVIFANSIDFANAVDFFDFLKNKGHEVITPSTTVLENYKKEKFIIILGGPDAPEGVGEVVRQVLSEDEQKFLRQKGNRKMFVKTNVWTQGQVVFVIAGSDRTETKKAHEENRDEADKKII